MPTIKYSDSFRKEYLKITSNNTVLAKRTLKTLEFLASDARHPSLRFHKVRGNDTFSISVTMKIRIIIQIDDDSVFLLSIRPHDSAYRM